ncbi:MAG: hypothetical protein K9L57_06075 [Spirochaetaceae bacterium]|nr:hypothetical protein [Spirochaetaceae bacterium]
MEDIVSLVTENPEYSEQYDDFLSSNAGRMLTEMFAFIADQLATRIDWVVNENFIGTATQKSSVIKILKLLGYNFDLPIASEVKVTTKINQPIGSFYLTPVYDNSGSLTPFSISAEDRNGVMRNFEALNYNDEAGTYDYKGGVEINSGDAEDPNLTHYIDFYEGTTYIEEYTAETDNNPIFILSRSPVIEGSIQVYEVSQESGGIIETRLNEVNSFLDPEAQNEYDEFGNALPLTYKLNIEENDTVTVEFPPTTLVPDASRRLRTGDTIRIFFRTGGGIDGNITARSINVTKTMAINGKSVDINFVNESKGTGGRDGETAEHAAVYAPLSIRTAEKTVTEEDYDIVVNAENTVVKARSYGNNNIAPSVVYNKYGKYIHPLEVWHFILKDKPGWEDVPPSRYDDFQWISLRLENRFNEVHSFRDGEFDKEVLAYSSNLDWETSIDWNGDDNFETFYNYIIIDTPNNLKDNIYTNKDDGIFNQDFLFKLTEKEVGTYFFGELSTYNTFQERDTSNNGLIEGTTPTWQIRQIVPAMLKSEVDLSNNVDLSSKYLLSISVDNRPAIEMDVSGSTASDTTADEIISAINTAFTNSTDYNNGASGSKGYQELGLSVDASSDASLSDGDKYYLVINGYEKEITYYSGDTYSDLADKIQEQLNFTINADVNGQSTKITDIDYDWEQIEKGMSISGYGIPDGTTVDKVSAPDRTITLSTAATSSSENETLTLSGYSVQVVGSSPSQDIRINNIGCYPKYSVRIESGISGSDFLSALSTTVNAPELGSGVSGYQQVGLSVDLTTTSPLSNSTDYYFKINDYEYSITTGTDDTYNDIISLLDSVLDPNYTVSSTGSTGTDDIEFTNDTSGPVYLEAGESGNDLFEGLYETSDYSLETPIGGGDYSDIGRITNYILINDEYYVEVKSPNKGDASKLVFTETSDNNLNALEKIFDLTVGGDYPAERKMYGYRKLTVITNTSSDNFGNLIFENGSINFEREQNSHFINYLIDDIKSFDIGKYHNENYSEDDPSWRIVADRIYNTVYDKNRLTIDLNASEFEVRFTENSIDESSIYVIDDSWTIQESENATVESVQNPQENIDSSNYYITLQFDDKPTVDNIDITSDNFAADSYSITEITNNINNIIRNASGYEDDLLYVDFDFARLNEAGDKIIFKSPLNNNDSKIVISPSTVDDAVNEIFGLDEGETHEFHATGDYFIDYDENKDLMTMNKLTSNGGSNMPDLPFYFHFIFDKRTEEGIYDGEEGRPGFQKGTIDEDIYEAEFSTYKITGLDHVYNSTKFNTFDIKGTVYYNKVYSKEDVQNRVENNLGTQFGLDNVDYGETTPKSKILSTIHESDGVEYVILEYLGPNAQKPETGVENTIESAFNEINLLSEDQFSAGLKIHGIIFDYKISE